MKTEKNYWTKRYLNHEIGWDIGYPSTPIKEYIDQLEHNNSRILIAGAGNAYEAEYLWKAGFKNVFILDISEIPLKQFQERNPDFPKHQLLLEDFFEHKGKYDLIFEQTFFCSFIPTDENRMNYAKKMADLLNPEGKLVGVWFDIPLTFDNEKRPFGGDKALYLKYLNPFFEIQTFKKCYNSISARKGTELFGIFKTKNQNNISS